MTTTNYLSPADFKKMVDAIPLVTEYNKSKLHEHESVRVVMIIFKLIWDQLNCRGALC